MQFEKILLGFFTLTFPHLIAFEFFEVELGLSRICFARVAQDYEWISGLVFLDTPVYCDYAQTALG